ncbi:Transcription factor MADS-box [Penicillium chermesinum]|uniref:Transcription factor MADS-box n=1 Tax=Penicillium chermesinum TaxID=63820 RepID=A0A9W9P5P4_9EURO|nr:Transcription factor MADS-box [Penicillium chermesinum]KAJ5238277.1 Transcription factor MADS-box [Penicillium chermesinum]
MSGKSREQPNRSKVEKKVLRQKRDRRRTVLEKKALEYSKICGADVCLGIRIRQSEKVFIVSADASGFWSLLGSKLSAQEDKNLCFYIYDPID